MSEEIFIAALTVMGVVIAALLGLIGRMWQLRNKKTNNPGNSINHKHERLLEEVKDLATQIHSTQMDIRAEFGTTRELIRSSFAEHNRVSGEMNNVLIKIATLLEVKRS